MAFFFQELVNGLTTGALYALVALGFSMVYGVLKLLNFAHGDLYMIGAYVGFFVIQWFGGPSALTIPVPLLLLVMFVLAAGLVGGLGVAIERFAYRPLRDAPRIAPLISALGVSFFLAYSMQLLFGAQYRDYDLFDASNGVLFLKGFSIGNTRISYIRDVIILSAFALMIALWFLVNKTRT